MADRHAVRCAKATEIVTLHDAEQSLPTDVPLAARQKQEAMSMSINTNFEQVVRADAELGELELRLDRGASELAALRVRNVLRLGPADAELDSRMAVLFIRALADNLAVVQLQHRDRYMTSVICEETGHSDRLAITPERMGPIPRSVRDRAS